jgi:hypothetical protein
MTDFNKLSSYEAFRDPNSGAVVFTGSRGFKQAQVRRKLVEERQKEQETIRDLVKIVQDLQGQVIALNEVIDIITPPEA